MEGVARATGERAAVRVCLHLIMCAWGVCVARATRERAAVRVCLHLVMCMGCVCGTCDKGACNGACLFALDSVHGACVWQVQQGSVQWCVFVCSAYPYSVFV
jgi:hypothetical protein